MKLRMPGLELRVRMIVILLCVVVGGVTLALGGCHGSSSAASSSTAPAVGSEVSALATSTVGQQAKADATAVLAGCFPVAGGKVQVPASKVDLTKDITCEKVPAGSRLKAAACVASAVANGGATDKTGKETALLDAVAACIEKYRNGGPSPSASAS